jgi:hypothetical protein
MHASVASSACHLTTGPSVDWREPTPTENGRAKDEVCGRSTSGWSSPAPDTVGDDSLRNVVMVVEVGGGKGGGGGIRNEL